MNMADTLQQLGMRVSSLVILKMIHEFMEYILTLLFLVIDFSESNCGLPRGELLLMELSLKPVQNRSWYCFKSDREKEKSTHRFLNTYPKSSLFSYKLQT